MPHNFEEGNKLEFIACLCHYVLLKTLLYGNRRRITKLERVGRRLHRIIENFFKQIPFLRLSIEVDPPYFLNIFNENMNLKILLVMMCKCAAIFRKGGSFIISHSLFPPFLRFNKIQLWY